MLAAVRGVLSERTGLRFSSNRMRDLERGLRAASDELGYANPAEFAQAIIDAPIPRDQFDTLTGYLTIGETYFFREERSIAALRERILPELIARRAGDDRMLRIWSAGCSTGEEPYTIAMLLNEMLPEIRTWRVTLLATDINVHSLETARNAVYGRWSFRGTPEWIKDKYFVPSPGGRLMVREDIRERVTFEYLNLAESSYPSLLNNTNAMDIVLCRNVLMYFLPDVAERVILGFFHSLVDGGWLHVAAAEASHQFLQPFVSVHFEGTTFYRKDRSHKGRTRHIDLRPKTPAVGLPPLPPKQDFVFHFTVPDPVSSPAVDLPPAPEPRPDPPEPRTPAAEKDFARAVEVFERGAYADAIARLDALAAKAEAHEPGAPDLHTVAVLLARAHANLGKLEEALAWCTRAVAAAKLHAEYHYLQATILRELSRDDEAVAALRKALYLEPGFVLAHFALGGLHERGGRDREAVKAYENVRALLENRDPDEVLPESDGLTAGRLSQIVTTMTVREVAR